MTSSSANPTFETSTSKKTWTLPANPNPSNPATMAINNTPRISYPIIRVAAPIVALGSFPTTPIMTNPTAPKIHKNPIQRSSSVSFDNSNGVSKSSINQSLSGLSSDQLSKTNLYIRGLKPETNDKDLLNMCSQYGSISSTKAIIDQATGKCKGYGFVDFNHEKGAEAAVKALQSNGIQAQMAKQQEQDSTNLYIANLPDHFNESDLERLISTAGGIISTRILREPSGKSRGVGFARMDTRECCEKVIQTFNKTCLPNQKEPLTVKFADGGSKKRLHHYQNNNNSNSNNNNSNNNNNNNMNVVNNSGNINSISRPSWMDHNESNVQHTFEQLAAVTPGALAQFATMPRYVASSPMGGFIQAPSGWLAHYPQGFYMQNPFATMLPGGLQTTGPTVDPNLYPQLTTQIGQLQIAPTPAFLPQMQANTAYMQIAYSTAPQPHLQPINVDDSCDPMVYQPTTIQYINK